MSAELKAGLHLEQIRMLQAQIRMLMEEARMLQAQIPIQHRLTIGSDQSGAPGPVMGITPQQIDSLPWSDLPPLPDLSLPDLPLPDLRMPDFSLPDLPAAPKF